MSYVLHESEGDWLIFCIDLLFYLLSILLFKCNNCGNKCILLDLHVARKAFVICSGRLLFHLVFDICFGVIHVYRYFLF